LGRRTLVVCVAGDDFELASRIRVGADRGFSRFPHHGCRPIAPHGTRRLLLVLFFHDRASASDDAWSCGFSSARVPFLTISLEGSSSVVAAMRRGTPAYVMACNGTLALRVAKGCE
jgi:hypothetical protein